MEYPGIEVGWGNYFRCWILKAIKSGAQLLHSSHSLQQGLCRKNDPWAVLHVNYQVRDAVVIQLDPYPMLLVPNFVPRQKMYYSELPAQRAHSALLTSQFFFNYQRHYCTIRVHGAVQRIQPRANFHSKVLTSGICKCNPFLCTAPTLFELQTFMF